MDGEAFVRRIEQELGARGITKGDFATKSEITNCLKKFRKTTKSGRKQSLSTA